MNPLEQLARHVVGTNLADLPPAARRATATFLLDTLGAAVAGSAEPWAARLVAAAAGWGAGEEAQAWVHGARLPAPSAALVNAYCIHCLEFDCVHEGAVVHPMATLVPAVLAHAGQAGGVSGRDLLPAIAVGVDVAATLGQGAGGPMRFFRPATAGAFGATAALCKLAGLDEEGTLNALGAVYGQISGTLQPHAEGSPLLAMQMGFNARAALTALHLAQAGIPAPRDVLLGRYGYFTLFEQDGAGLEAALARLGTEWQVTRLSHKPFPSGRLTHGAVDALLKLRTRHGFGAEEVARVVVRVPPLVHQLVSRADVPDPSPNYARLCLAFVAATALAYDTVDVPHFFPERLRDPAVHGLAARVEVVRDDNPDPAAMVPQTVEVTLRGGARHGLTLERVLGHPDAPLGEARHLEKFRRCWGYGARPLPAEAGEALLEKVAELEEVADARELTALLVP